MEVGAGVGAGRDAEEADGVLQFADFTAALYWTVGGIGVLGVNPIGCAGIVYPPPEATHVAATGAEAATVWAMVTCWSQAGRTMCVQ